MLTVEQMVTLIESSLAEHEGNSSLSTRKALTIAAQKIHDLCQPDHTIHVAAAALENEVTSTLMDMLAATILATLINEEGGGRTNVQFSPGSMAETLAEWNYAVSTEGLVRTVRIVPKAGEDWEPTVVPPVVSKLAGVLHKEQVNVDDAKPQAEPHVYDRPLWVVTLTDENGLKFLRGHDRADAERMMRSLTFGVVGHIENRYCLHTECPASGCTHTEATSDT